MGNDRPAVTQPEEEMWGVPEEGLTENSVTVVGYITRWVGTLRYRELCMVGSTAPSAL